MISPHITLGDLLTQAKPGDLIGTASKGTVGTTIRLGAQASNLFSWPPQWVRFQRTWSHVGMVYPPHPLTGQLTILESTTQNTANDLYSSKNRYGVAMVDLVTRLRTTKGKVFWRPRLHPASDEAQEKAFLGHLYRQLMGRSYERLGSVSGLWNMVDAELFDYFNLGNEVEEGRRVFCSELVAGIARRIWPAYWPREKLPSQTSPTDLAINFNNIWAETREVEV